MEGLAQRLDQPLDSELAVPQLAALVLGDRSQHRARLADHARLLNAPERGRGLDVEERLDARLGLLRVLAARPTRPREAQLDLRHGDPTDRVTE